MWSFSGRGEWDGWRQKLIGSLLAAGHGSFWLDTHLLGNTHDFTGFGALVLNRVDNTYSRPQLLHTCICDIKIAVGGKGHTIWILKKLPAGCRQLEIGVPAHAVPTQRGAAVATGTDEGTRLVYAGAVGRVACACVLALVHIYW
jgi:hypothetical protein